MPTDSPLHEAQVRWHERDAAVTIKINGTTIARKIPTRLLLSDFIRDEIGLTGTHVGCGEGACGACTVMIDGVAARSCTMFTVQVGDSEITTIEGLNLPVGLNALQSAFKAHHALQCGFCTPGILISLTALRQTRPLVDEADIRECLTGHLCRCTGYQNIVAAAMSWNNNMMEQSHESE